MIRAGERGLFVGKTGSGKSQAIAVPFARHGGQRLLIDVQDAYELGPAALEEGASEARRVSEIDWSKRTIRYVPRTLAPQEFDELYREIYARGEMLVWCDELEDVAPVRRTPTWVRKVIKQGRKRGLTHLGATQRPFGVDPVTVNQSEKAFVFDMVDPSAFDVLAPRFGMSSQALGEVVRHLERGPEGTSFSGFVYHDLSTHTVAAMPPIPAEIVESTREHVLIP